MLRSPDPNDPERILAMGPFGAGKSTGWLRIADWAQKTDSPAHFYVLDSEGSTKRMMNPSGSFGHLTNVTVFNVWEWSQYERALDTALAAAKAEDWIVVDFISPAWDAVQEWYVDQIYESDMAEFFFEARKSMKGGNPLDGWKDWSVINRVYKRWITKMLQECPAHVYWTANAEPIRDTDDKNLRAVFGAHGVRPKGQKHLGHQPHTVLLMQPFAGGEWYMTTIKDRERPRLEGQKVSDFVIDFLVNVAGWEL